MCDGIIKILSEILFIYTNAIKIAIYFTSHDMKKVSYIKKLFDLMQRILLYDDNKVQSVFFHTL